MQSKYLLPSCCIYDSIQFDMQHNHIIIKMNLHHLTLTQGSGGERLGAAGKILLPCCYMYHPL